MYYLVNDVTILCVDLGDGPKIPEDPKRLIELTPKNRMQIQSNKEIRNKLTITNHCTATTTTKNTNNEKTIKIVDDLRVGALVLVFVSHKEEEGVHT